MTPDSKTRQQQIYRVTLWGSLGNFCLMAFKFVAGFVGHSSAMIADAVHSISDFVTDIVVLAFVRISGKPQDRDHEYGHGKYETLATAIIGLSLLGVGIYLFYSSAVRIWEILQGAPAEPPRWIALIAAVVSIVVKEGLYQYTMRSGRRLQSPAVMANAWHHRSDALSSIGTLLGISGAMFLGHNWVILDPAAACLVSVLIVKVSIDMLRSALGELLDHALPAELEQQILKKIDEEPDVYDPHNLRTRRIGSRVAIDLHIRMPDDMTVAHSHEVTRRVEHELRTIFGPDTIVNLHVEPLSGKHEEKK